MHLQEVASAKWQVHGKPLLGPLMHKVILMIPGVFLILQ